MRDLVDMVVASADLFPDGFLLYFRMMVRRDPLWKVFVDACHLAMTAHNWRPKLAHIGEVRAIGVLLILLTATLPVRMEAEVETIFGLHSTLLYIRALTARPKTRYAVKAGIGSGTL